MARYIDADAFIGKLKTSKDFQKKYATFREVKMTEMFIASVENELTADVAEIKHGEWKGKPIAGYSNIKCSVCNTRFVQETGTWNYCPECGAKMDGGNV